MIDLDKKTKSNLGQWLETGGKRPKGSLNKFTLQKQEFFKACRDGKLFLWVQSILDGKDDRKKLEILKVWASLQPREVRAELEGMTGPSVIIIRADGAYDSKKPVAEVIDVKGGENVQHPQIEDAT